MQKLNIDFSGNSGILALGAASVTAAIPANTKLLGVSTTGNCHIRLSTLALATAVATDPLLTPNSEIQILQVPGDAVNVSVIQDAASTGNLSFFRVMEY